MPPIADTTQDLHLGGRAHRGQHRFGVGLRVVDINAPAFAMYVLGQCLANEEARGQRMLLTGFTAMEGRPKFKQSKVHETTRLIACRRLQQAWQKRGAHVAHFRTDRVFQSAGIITTIKKRSRFLIDEAVGHTFVVTERRHGAPCRDFAVLHGCQNGLGHTCRAFHRDALEFGQGGDTGNFFNQIGLSQNVRAPGWHMRHVTFHTEAKRFQ